MKNLLEQYLDALEVRHTRWFADKLYNEHPHRDNMYGLKRMLDVYGVKMLGVHFKDKDPAALTFPCILHVPNDFVIGMDYAQGKVICLSHGKQTAMALEKFKEVWTGNALVVGETTDAAEPGFRKNQSAQLLSWCKAMAIPAILFLMCLVGVVQNAPDYTWFHLAGILFSLSGVAVCSLLLQKQLFGKSRYGDKVCTLFYHAGCNSILDGEHAKFMGMSWSEIGMGYFVAGVLLLSLCPSFAGCVAAVCWLAMGYGVWSVYYQWRVAHSWCVLCVMVQALVWMMGVAAMVWCAGHPLRLGFTSCALSCSVFALCIMVSHQGASLFVSGKERTQAKQQYDALKANRLVARALIEDSQYYEVTLEDSSLLFGNPEAGMRITILSNPFCNPCAKAHEQVERLLDLCGDDLCVQYVLTYFNPELEGGCRYLLSCYDAQDMAATRKAFAGWYAKDKYNYKELVRQNADKLHTAEMDKEMERHRAWRKKTGFTATPTILVNGYALPTLYSISGLSMIAGVEVPSHPDAMKIVDIDNNGL